jgi:hypothetical protein
VPRCGTFPTVQRRRVEGMKRKKKKKRKKEREKNI